MINMMFNVVLRFFDSTYKVSLTWDSNPRPSDFRYDALPTELAAWHKDDLAQSMSTREVTKGKCDYFL